MKTLLKSARRRGSRPSLRPAVPGSAAFSQALPWLLTSVAMSMLVLVGEVPWWMLLAFAASTGWRYAIERRRLALPSFLVRLGFFVPMMVSIFWSYGGHLSAAAMLTYLVGLLSLKVLELRSARDFTVVALLGFFMTLSAFFYNQSLVVTLYLGVAVLGNVIALVRVHGGGERSARPAVRLAVVMIGQSLPLVVLLFIIFPRLQGSFLRRLTNDTKGVTGMSSHLQPGSFSSLAQSTETAFRARILSAGPTLTSPQLYWRGLVMDLCDHGLSWRASEIGAGTDETPVPTHGVLRVEQQITAVAQGERWLFALDHPVSVQAAPGSQIRLTTPNVVRSALPLISTTIYTVVSELAPPPNLNLTTGEQVRYTRLPSEISQPVRALAAEWKARARSDEDIVRSALAYFRDGHFTYTLTPGVLAPSSGLDVFLFRTKAGFCEHYSAAFCTLMRAAGLPARVVVGYQGGEFNTWGSGHYVVRQSDAHAWAEVWLAGHGWTREDPTAVVAPDRVSFGADDYSTLMADGPLSEESRLDRLRRLRAPSTLRWLAHNTLLAWDGLDQEWNVLVLGYDQEQQWDLLQRFGLGSLSWVGGTLLTLVAAFSLLAGGTLSYRLWERRGTRDRADLDHRMYLRFCRRLAAAGARPRMDHEGPLDYARRASADLPPSAEEIQRITSLFIAARYARPAPVQTDGKAQDPSTVFRTAVGTFRPAALAAR